MKWFTKLSLDTVGHSTYCVIEADNEDEALGLAREECISFAESYGYYQDEDHFGELDSVGKDFDEEADEYEQTGFLDYTVVPYVHKYHGNYVT